MEEERVVKISSTESIYYYSGNRVFHHRPYVTALDKFPELFEQCDELPDTNKNSLSTNVETTNADSVSLSQSEIMREIDEYFANRPDDGHVYESSSNLELYFKQRMQHTPKPENEERFTDNNNNERKQIVIEDCSDSGSDTVTFNSHRNKRPDIQSEHPIQDIQQHQVKKSSSLKMYNNRDLSDISMGRQQNIKGIISRSEPKMQTCKKTVSFEKESEPNYRTSTSMPKHNMETTLEENRIKVDSKISNPESSNGILKTESMKALDRNFKEMEDKINTLDKQVRGNQKLFHNNMTENKSTENRENEDHVPISRSNQVHPNDNVNKLKELGDVCRQGEIAYKSTPFAFLENRQRANVYEDAHLSKKNINVYRSSEQVQNRHREEFFDHNDNLHAVNDKLKYVFKEQCQRCNSLEKEIKQLQKNALEFEECLSMAQDVGDEKKAIINDLQKREQIAQADYRQLRLTFENLSSEYEYCKEKIHKQEEELKQSVFVVTEIQNKFNQLHDEFEKMNKIKTEKICSLNKELSDLFEKYEISKGAEEKLKSDFQKAKMKVLKYEHISGNLKIKNSELIENNNALCIERDNIQAEYEQLLVRADKLEVQVQKLQMELHKSTENIPNFQEVLNSKMNVLRAQYQQQLDEVLQDKVKEYERRLYELEEQLNNEAHEREIELSEYGFKQLRIVNEKTELEIAILQEKHEEELKLESIKLAAANDEISKLKSCLRFYKSKQGEIAANLHKIMTTQWKKVLKLLTSPRTSELKCDDSRASVKSKTSEGTSVQTGISSKLACSSTLNTKLHLNTCKCKFADGKCSGDYCKKKHQENLDEKRLHEFISMLLDRSPAHVKKLDEILASMNSQRGKSRTSMASSKKKKTSKKPPWKI